LPDAFELLINGILVLLVGDVVCLHRNDLEVGKLEQLLYVFLDDKVFKFGLLFLPDLLVGRPSDFEELVDVLFDELLDALVGLKVGGDLNDLHDLVVEVVGGVDVQGLDHAPQLVYRLYLAAPQHVVDHQLPQVIHRTVLRVIE
jgi:hypothetical protein